MHFRHNEPLCKNTIYSVVINSSVILENFTVIGITALCYNNIRIVISVFDPVQKTSQTPGDYLILAVVKKNVTFYLYFDPGRSASFPTWVTKPLSSSIYIKIRPSYWWISSCSSVHSNVMIDP
jgi:hypothetical protein